jgi:hypothetical protein
MTHQQSDPDVAWHPRPDSAPSIVHLEAAKPSNARPQNRERWIVLSAAVLIAAAAIGGGILTAEPWQPRLRLPDGTSLRWIGATYGVNHPTPEDPIWHERLSRLIGRLLGTQGPALRGSTYTSPQGIVLWFKREAADPVLPWLFPPPRRPKRFRDPILVVATPASQPTLWLGTQSVNPATGKGGPEALEITRPFSRKPRVRIALYLARRGELPATPHQIITVDNPFAGTPPVWVPQAQPVHLPAPATGITIESAGLSTRLLEPSPDSWPHGVLDLEAVVAGSAQHQPIGLTLDDAFGVSYLSGYSSQFWNERNGRVKVKVPGLPAPVPGEPLKLTLWLTPKRRAAPGAPVFRARVHIGRQRVQDVRAALGAVRIWVSKATRTVPDAEPDGTWPAGVRVAVSEPDIVLQIDSAVDQDGRPISTRWIGWSKSGRNGTLSGLAIRTHQESRWVDLVLRACPIKKVECILPPGN